MDTASISNSERARADTAAEVSLLEQLLSMARASALEEMASGITHELNQPLGAIVTYAQAGERLLDRPEATLDTAREVLKLIGQEALAAAAAVRRVRKPFQRSGLDKSPCAMSEVVRELGTVIEPRAAAAQVNLEFELETALPTVDIHRLRVQHVLFTLAQNAIEAARAAQSSPPHVTITVSGDRYGVETAVLDNGIGVADAHRAQIFRPFFTTKPHGSGLGLAGARAIVEWHGGTIGFQPQGPSGSPQGSRFWFRLPASCALI